jgi:hypothetical protein
MQTQPVNIRSHFSHVTFAAANSSGYAQSAPTAIPTDISPSSILPPFAPVAAISHFPAKNHQCLMLLTIGIDCVNQCRQLLMRTCGDGIVFIRTQPVAHAEKIKVWLGVSDAVTGQVMDTVMRALPSAEFGRITHEPA